LIRATQLPIEKSSFALSFCATGGGNSRHSFFGLGKALPAAFRACPHLGAIGAAETSIHRMSADLELTDATLWHA